MTEIRPATVKHFERLKGTPPPKSARAFAAVRGEDVIGIAGVYRDGPSLVLFSELTDELRHDKRAGVRLKRAVMPLIAGKLAYAQADPAIDGSDKLLLHLGFELCHGRTYQWRG